MTINATADSASAPPKVTVDVSLPVGSVMKTAKLERLVGTTRELVRAQPGTGFDARTVSDFDAPYEVPISYVWTSEYFATDAFATTLNETWASLAAWSTAAGAGAWSVSAGTAVFTGPISSVAKITYALASGKYRITIAAPPVGLTQIDFGGFRIDLAARTIVTGSRSVSYLPGTGAWVINVTSAAVSLTTTAGTYSIDVPVAVTKVEFSGPRIDPFIQPSIMNLVRSGLSWTPVSSVTDGTGRIFVLCTRFSGSTPLNRVLIFNAGGIYLTGQDLPAGTGNGQFTSNAIGLAVDSANRLIIGDYEAGRIQRFTISGTGGSTTFAYLDKVGTIGSGNGQFLAFSIVGITTDSADNVYVAQSNANRVQKFTSALAYSTQWGTYGPADNQFYSPRAITSDGTSIFVADYGYAGDSTPGYLRKFSATGVFAWKTAITPDPSYQPTAVVVDSYGQLIVANGKRNLDVYSSTGVKVQTITSPDVGSPIRALALDSARTILWAFERSTFYTADQIILGNAVIDDVKIESYGGIRSVTETSNTVTLTPSASWLIHPAKPALSFPLLQSDGSRAGLSALGSIGNASTATVHEILGSDLPVVTTSGPRASDRVLMELTTATRAEENQVKALLRDQTPILIRMLPSWLVDFDDGFYSVGDVQRERLAQMSGLGLRHIALPLTAVDSPDVNVESAGWSWAALVAEFSSWTPGTTDPFATWADEASNTRRSGF